MISQINHAECGFMFHRLKKQFRTTRFNLSARGVHETPMAPIDVGSSVIFVSQLCHRDMLMYLLAVKSLARYLPPRSVVALDDGSLTDADRSTLAAHVPGISIRPVRDVATGACPRGGTWERLLAIQDLTYEAFVVQVDADTLALDKPTEILSCVAENRSFTLGTSMGREFSTLAEAGAQAEEVSPNDPHVQDTAERAFKHMRDADSRFYVRGNSGFAGFAQGKHSREQVEEFSQEVAGLIGQEKWSEWGSEQVSSNYAVANSPGAQVLSYPKYGYFHPDKPFEGYPFLHFIGTYRFQRGVYARLAREVIAQLKEAVS